jgi:hypothetical protein
MDPLSFLMFRRFCTKIADGIDWLLDFWAWYDGRLTRKDYEEMAARPGAPGYLPRKSRKPF